MDHALSRHTRIFIGFRDQRQTPTYSQKGRSRVGIVLYRALDVPGVCR
jgi:hypothetical protein